MDCLVQLKFKPEDKQELVALCQKEYRHNRSQLSMIHEFELEYTQNTALLWFIHETFIHTMLYNALREQNSEQLLLFHFVLHDICEQMKQNPYNTSIRVYCGQIMTPNEKDYFDRSINNYISNYSFLSTSINRDKVLNRLRHLSLQENYQALFIIDADPSIVAAKPFMDISKLNSFINETEILFMVGCIFRLIQVENDDDIIVIRMTLCGVNDSSLKFLFDKKKILNEYADENNEISRRSFGDIVHQLKKFNLAIQIYQHMLNALSSNDPLYCDLCRSIGHVYKDNNDPKQSRTYYRKALKHLRVSTSSDHIMFAVLCAAIGDIDCREKNFDKALEWYEKAVNELRKENAHDDRHMANFLNNMAGIYKQKKDYLASIKLFNEALAIDEKNSSCNSLNVAKSHNNIAIIHYLLKEYDQALQRFQQALRIRLLYLPEQHISIAEIYGNIGLVYETMNNLQQASIYYKKASNIYHLIYKPNHEEVIKIDNTLNQILKRLK